MAQAVRDVYCDHCGVWLSRWATGYPEPPARPECPECRRLSLHIEPMKEQLEGIRLQLHELANAVNSLVLRLVRKEG